MHKDMLMHRDIKPENVFLTMVFYMFYLGEMCKIRGFRLVSL